MIWMIMIGFMVVGGIVSARLKSKFKKYSQIATLSGMSGKEIAEKMLVDNNIYDVKVISVPGKLTDHYNPMDKTVNLSPEVYSGRSVSAAAVAAHEVGHAVQHATGYKWLDLRSQLVPIANLSGRIMNIVIISMIFGMSFLHLFGMNTIIYVLIAAQATITVVTVITLPVEYDASNRALAWLTTSGTITPVEHEKAGDALKWAARTYLVAALASMTQLAYYLSMLGRD